MTARRPRHIGFIPDGNRRWADARGLPRGAGYEAGIAPGIQLLRACREAGVEEVSIYGFTKENVRRPPEQVAAFRNACVGYARGALEQEAALLVVGDHSSHVFPDELRLYAERRTRGKTRVNLLVNYGWQWDLYAAMRRVASNGNVRISEISAALASADVSRIDLVVRWGGRRRLSGFLPIQTAYADLYVVDSLWPDMQLDEFRRSLEWYAEQDVTLGG